MKEKTFEEVLRDTPWRSIVIPFALSLIIVALFLVITVRAQDEPTQEKPLVVIHRFEAHAFHYNPATHEVSQQEQADGGMILSIRPKAAK